MATATEVRRELYSRFRAAEKQQMIFIDISARHLHDAVQRCSPTDTPRIPLCCSVMRQEQKVGVDVVISERASDYTDFAIRFRLPRQN